MRNWGSLPILPFLCPRGTAADPAGQANATVERHLAEGRAVHRPRLSQGLLPGKPCSGRNLNRPSYLLLLVRVLQCPSLNSYHPRMVAELQLGADLLTFVMRRNQLDSF